MKRVKLKLLLIIPTWAVIPKSYRLLHGLGVGIIPAGLQDLTGNCNGDCFTFSHVCRQPFVQTSARPKRAKAAHSRDKNISNTTPRESHERHLPLCRLEQGGVQHLLEIFAPQRLQNLAHNSAITPWRRLVKRSASATESTADKKRVLDIQRQRHPPHHHSQQQHSTILL